jgi:hypothetical protein
MSTDIPAPEWEIDPGGVSSNDLLYELENPLGEGRLAEVLCESFEDDWIPIGALGGTPEEQLHWGWDLFVETIKSSSRFVFLHPAAHRTHYMTEINAAEMLDRLGEVIDACGALIPLPKGQPLLRGRKHHADTVLESADELGPPPAQLTPGQRMNPPGIPFCYGAHEERTALAELRGLDGEVATVAKWCTARDSYIVDLARLLPVASIFDQNPYAPRHQMKFLYRFAEEISKSMRAHDNSEVDYVPTQVVAEFIRRCLHAPLSEEPVEGLSYSSAIHPGDTNVVFFADDVNKGPLLTMIRTPTTFEAIDVATNWRPVEPD